MPDPADRPPEDSADALADALVQNAALPQAGDSTEPPAEPPIEPTFSAPTDGPPAEPPVAAPDQSQPTSAPATEPQPSADDPLKLTKVIDEACGKKYARKYRDDWATLHGLVSAADRLAQRDADAEYGRAFRGHEAAFQEFLQQQQSPPQEPPAQQAPPSWEQIEAWRAEVARSPDNPPLEARRGLEQAQRMMERAAYQLATDPEQIVAPVARPLVAQETRQTVNQNLAAQAEQDWINQFEQQHKEWLYHAGGPMSSENLTPDGSRLMQYAAFEQQRGRNPADALRYAYLSLHAERSQQQQQQQPAPQVQPVSPAAQHQPAVAAPPAGDPDADYQKFLKGDVEDHIAEWLRRNQGATGTR